jgi:hypothetical protein
MKVHSRRNSYHEYFKFIKEIESVIKNLSIKKIRI